MVRCSTSTSSSVFVFDEHRGFVVAAQEARTAAQGTGSILSAPAFEVQVKLDIIASLIIGTRDA